MYFFNNTSAIVYFVGTRVSIYKIYIKHKGLRSTHKGWYYWRVYCMKITFSVVSWTCLLLCQMSLYTLKLCLRCTMKLNIQIIKSIELQVVSKILSFKGDPVRRCSYMFTGVYIIQWQWIYGTVQMYLHKGIESLTHKLKYSNAYIVAAWWCKPLIFQT